MAYRKVISRDEVKHHMTIRIQQRLIEELRKIPNYTPKLEKYIIQMIENEKGQ